MTIVLHSFPARLSTPCPPLQLRPTSESGSIWMLCRLPVGPVIRLCHAQNLSVWPSLPLVRASLSQTPTWGFNLVVSETQILISAGTALRTPHASSFLKKCATLFLNHTHTLSLSLPKLQLPGPEGHQDARGVGHSTFNF